VTFKDKTSDIPNISGDQNKINYDLFKENKVKICTKVQEVNKVSVKTPYKVSNYDSPIVYLNRHPIRSQIDGGSTITLTLRHAKPVLYEADDVNNITRCVDIYSYFRASTNLRTSMRKGILQRKACEA